MLVDAAGLPILGMVTSPVWAIVAAIGSVALIWIGATAKAPIQQRNEARESSEQSEANLEAVTEAKATVEGKLVDERRARATSEKERQDALARLAMLENTRTIPGLLVSRAHISFQNGLTEFVNSHNVTSVTDGELGTIIITWSQDYADSEYDVNINVKGGHAELDSVSPGSVIIRTFAYGGTPEDARDVMDIRVSALGDYASTPSIAGTEGSLN